MGAFLLHSNVSSYSTERETSYLQCYLCVILKTDHKLFNNDYIYELVSSPKSLKSLIEQIS